MKNERRNGENHCAFSFLHSLHFRLREMTPGPLAADVGLEPHEGRTPL
jgi:hypothetical protein